MYFNVKLNRFLAQRDGSREYGAILLSGSSTCGG
jgi:hypothetical protein